MDQAKESTESTGQNQTIVRENMDAQKAYEESVGTWSHITNSEIDWPSRPSYRCFYWASEVGGDGQYDIIKMKNYRKVNRMSHKIILSNR